MIETLLAAALVAGVIIIDPNVGELIILKIKHFQVNVQRRIMQVRLKFGILHTRVFGLRKYRKLIKEMEREQQRI